MIYCDNAAGKPLTQRAIKTIQDFITNGYSNPSAVYSRGRKAKIALEQSRQSVAKAIGANADEIYFTSGSTEGINWFCKDAVVYTTTIEHKALMRSAKYFLPVDNTGRMNLDYFSQNCPHDSCIAIGWINNEIGIIQPIKEIVEISHKNGCSLLVDATQAIGKIPINVHDLDIDFMVGSFGKIGGLTGSGFMYIKHGNLIEPMIKGGKQENGLRAGTENLLGILVGGQVIEEAVDNIIQRANVTMQKRNYIIKELLKIPDSCLNGGLENRASNNINISFRGVDSESLVLICDSNGLCISAGSACNSGSLEPSHVLKSIGLDDDTARSSIRITINNDISEAEIKDVVRIVKESVEFLRKGI